MTTILLTGMLGGIVRGLVGYSKYHFAYKAVKFNWKYFLLMVGVSGFAGLTISWSISESGLDLPLVDNINPAIAFIIGYAGGDIIENLYKMLVGKATLFNVVE